MINRKPHVLSSGSKVTRPNRVIFFDTETSQHYRPDGVTEHTLRLGYALFCQSRRGETLRTQDEHKFYGIGEFWDWLESRLHPKTKTYLVAHNLNYDIPVLHAFDELAARDFEITGFYSQGMVSIIRWRKGDVKLTALDNGNFFAGKLAKWGKIVEREKGVIDFETDDYDELMDYCMNDVLIMRDLWRLWIAFLDANDCGDFRPTVSSTAFSAYRRNFMPARIHIHANEEALELERDSYHGGRVECLFKGRLEDSQYFYVDVNSMYGYVMREFEYPTFLWGVSNKGSMGELKSRMSNYAVIAKVSLDVTQNYYPVQVNGYTAYPLGEFDTTLTTPELKIAFDNGWVKAVSKFSWYAKNRIFTDYVDTYHAVKSAYIDDNQEALAGIAKLLINGLYGKFGQRGFDQTTEPADDAALIFSETVHTDDPNVSYELMYLGGRLITTTRSGESHNSFPAIAAHVTAYARCHLFDLMLRVPERHRFYMDTDSLIVDAEGLEYLKDALHDTRLGALKIERQSPFLEINAPKDYAMQGRKRIKGVSASAIQTATNTYQQTQWSRMRGMIRKGNVSGYTTRPLQKRLRRTIHSGVLLRSGWITPFVLPLPDVDAPLTPDPSVQPAP